MSTGSDDSDMEELKSENERLKEELRKYKEEAETKTLALSSASKSVLKLEDFNTTARSIFDSCKELIGATAGYVALLSEDGMENEVLFLDAGGLPCTVDPSLPMPIRGLRGIAYEEGKVVYDNNFLKSKWQKFMPKGHAPLDNVLFAPLTVKGEVKGLVGLANKEGPFTEEDAKTVKSFAEIASIALSNTQILGDLKTSEEKYRHAFNRADFYKDLIIHDVNNVLCAISSSVGTYHLLKKNGDSDEELEIPLTIIKDQTVKGTSLIKNVQKILELTFDGLSLEKINLSGELKKAVAAFKANHPEKNMKIDLEMDDGDFLVMGNEFIQDVFENILLNAMRYNKSKIVEIHVRIYPRELNGEDFVIMSFKDNGIGIDDELKEIIFDRGNPDKKGSLGMGFGLSLIKQIVNSYNGDIWVEDAVEGDHTKGTVFLVKLPRVMDNTHQ